MEGAKRCTSLHRTTQDLRSHLARNSAAVDQALMAAGGRRSAGRFKAANKDGSSATTRRTMSKACADNGWSLVVANKAL